MKPWVFFCLLIGLTGCSLQPANTVSVISSATNLKYYYENGQALEFIDNAGLSDVEITQIIEAMDQIDRSKDRLQVLIDSPSQLVLNIHDVTYEYAKIKAAYLVVRDIALSNQAEYSSEEWRVLTEFDSSAQVLDTQFVDLIEKLETNKALNTALRLADTAIKIGTML
jgi:hypothetical protein